jgi:hypothetical protein
MIVEKATGERFGGRINLDAGKVETLVRAGIWTKADLDLHGLEEVPDPPPPVVEPPPEQTDQERIEAAVGLPLDRILTALGLEPKVRV